MIKEINKENLESEVVRFSELLLSGVIVFHYQKKDGTIRQAIGTLKSDLIPPSKERYDTYEAILKNINQTKTLDQSNIDEIESLFIPKESKGRNSSFENQTYYDFEAKAFRSFNKSSLISYII